MTAWRSMTWKSQISVYDPVPLELVHMGGEQDAGASLPEDA